MKKKFWEFADENDPSLNVPTANLKFNVIYGRQIYTLYIR